MSDGWIKLHRKLTEWEWFDDHNTFRLFIYLLLTTNHKPKQWKGATIKTGSKLTGINSLSEHTGLSVQQIRTSLKKLKETKEITIVPTNKYSIITITNWKKYQTDGKTPTNNQQTNNNQSTTNKNDNNDKNVKKVYTQNFLDIWKVYPKTRIGNQDKAFSAYKNALKRDTEANINTGVQAYIDSQEANTHPKGLAAWFNDDRWKNNYKHKGTNNGNSDPDAELARFLDRRTN